MANRDRELGEAFRRKLGKLRARADGPATTLVFLPSKSLRVGHSSRPTLEVIPAEPEPPVTFCDLILPATPPAAHGIDLSDS